MREYVVFDIIHTADKHGFGLCRSLYCVYRLKRLLGASNSLDFEFPEAVEGGR